MNINKIPPNRPIIIKNQSKTTTKNINHFHLSQNGKERGEKREGGRKREKNRQGERGYMFQCITY